MGHFFLGGATLGDDQTALVLADLEKRSATSLIPIIVFSSYVGKVSAECPTCAAESSRSGRGKQSPATPREPGRPHLLPARPFSPLEMKLTALAL